MNTKRLTQVCNITTGKLDANAEVLDGRYPFFTCAPEPSRIDTFAFDDDAILLAGNNAQGNFHIQRFKGKFNAYQRTYVITAKDGYDIDYIKYSLELSLQHLKRIAQGSQTKFLTMQILDSFLIADIPYDEQIRLISSIREADNKISINNIICLELEAMAKTLYDYWFTQFDFPNTEGKPYRSSGGEMVWNAQLKREIPKGWEAKRLSDICTFRNGINYEKGCAGNRIYKIANVRNITASSLLMDANDFDEISLPSEQADRYAIKKNDIIIARSGTPGATRLILKPADNVIFCGFIICCTPENSNHRMLLAHFLKQLEGTSATKTGGSILQNVSQDTLKSLCVAIPNDEVINSFNEKLAPMIEMTQHAIDENSELKKLRDWLLPMLMNGQATVSD